MAGTGGLACHGNEMTAARGPYGTLVDVRGGGIYAEWLGRKGLMCLLCRHPVTVHRRNTGNIFVRHGKNAPAGMIPAGGKVSETFEHARLKQWTRDRLAAYGLADVTVEPHIGDQYPDVYGTKDGIAYAVEIQWSDLAPEKARERTSGLRAAGCDYVLWVTRHRHWIETIPAVSLGEFRRTGPEDGYRVRSGFLAPQISPRTERLFMASRQCSLDGFLQRWITPGALAWAYTTPTTAGWATVTDWETFTRDQATEIVSKKRQLADALGERDRLRLQVTNAKRSIADNVATIAQQASTIDQTIEERADLARRGNALTSDLVAARKERADELRLRQAAEEQLAKLAAEVGRLEAGIKWRHIAIVALLVLCGALGVILLVG
ncbi:competence protein CoiA family protein [Nocardia fluminea]|uniref:competence protein CoiA family protein n=1 Tax=Nocardia fluminea TaxID=134984 RepID=UPI0036570625